MMLSAWPSRTSGSKRRARSPSPRSSEPGPIGALCRADDRIMELEQIDRVALQPLQAGFEGSGDRLTDLAALGGRQSHLGADIDIRLQRLQHPAEIVLGFAVAVHLRGVEIVDAELDRARDGAFLVGGGALDHQPADRAAAKAEQRYVETGAAALSVLHCCRLR